MVRRTNRRRIASGRKVRNTRRTATPRRTKNTRRTFRFKPWTPYEVKTLRQIFRDTPTKDVAKKLGRTISSVQGKAGDLGLRKSVSYMKKMRSSWH